MPRSHHEFTTEQFQCPVAGKTVDIDRTWNCLRGNDGAVVARAPIRTSCDNQDRCIVATHNGMSTSYDWSKCAYLNKPAA